MHRSILSKHSGLFKDLLSVPQPAGQAEGTEDDPLLVPDVSGDALGHLLRLVYRASVFLLTWLHHCITTCSWSSSQDIDIHVDQLPATLRAAHRLQFDNLFTSMVDVAHSQLGPQSRLRIGLECSVEAWRLPAFQEIVLDITLHPPEGAAILDDAVWLAVYRSRQNVIKFRTKTVAQPLVTKTLCPHALGAAAITLPHHPRKGWLRAYQQYMGQWGGYEACCVRNVTQDLFKLLAPSHEEELGLVSKHWNRFQGASI